jgi:hypothetical protein
MLFIVRAKYSDHKVYNQEVLILAYLIMACWDTVGLSKFKMIL